MTSASTGWYDGSRTYSRRELGLIFLRHTVAAIVLLREAWENR